jgi:hypothetical protein
MKLSTYIALRALRALVVVITIPIWLPIFGVLTVFGGAVQAACALYGEWKQDYQRRQERD